MFWFILAATIVVCAGLIWMSVSKHAQPQLKKELDYLPPVSEGNVIFLDSASVLKTLRDQERAVSNKTNERK